MAKLIRKGEQPHLPPSPPPKSEVPSIRQQILQLKQELEKEKKSQVQSKPNLDKTPFRLTFKKVLAAMGILVLVFVGYFGWKAYKAMSKIITRNLSGSAPALLGKLSPKDLAGEGDGRINILLLGIGGKGHAGENLADTVMLVSIDPVDHKTALLSLPRDMYVPIPGYGMNKLNTAYALGEESGSEGGGAQLSKQTVSNILDLPVHYYLRLDFEGFKKIIDAINGIDIDVPTELYDPFYPNGSYGYEVLHILPGKQHMDGALALKYARSRETTSDFDRAKRQQLVLAAVREKALSLEILTNPKKISELVDLLGDHLRTDLQLWELQKLAEMAKEIDPALIANNVLDDSNYLYGDSINGVGYVLCPRAGDFSEIQKFAHSIFKDAYLSKEAATILVRNGTTREGLGQRIAEKLKSYNYNVIGVENADRNDYKKTVILDYTGGKKPYTVSFLQKRLSAKIEKGTAPNAPADLVIIVGENAISAQ